ncbi:MAG: ABC transporter substrate-binding protein [Rhizobiales bacterium]|nr:ABC transporter substrate-binding protein [Hyphomicrobiales bacterium]
MTHAISRRSFTTVTSAAALGALLDLRSEAGAQARSSIAVRIERDLTVLDPAFRQGPHDGNVIRVVYQRLIAQKPNSAEVEFDAAAELKQVSPTLIEFTLKPGQMFTDGFGEMTAEDVKFSFERFAVAPVDGKESPYKGDWTGLTGVEVTGRLTGKIVLSKPNAGLFAIALADVSGCIMSKKAVTERGVEHNTRPVGSGPYQVASVERQRGAVLKRNPAYAGTKPFYEEIRVNFIQDPKTTELALRSGELDFAVLPPAVAEPLRNAQGLSVDQSPGLAYIWLGINMQKPPFDDVRVRQAIRLALDVDQMLLAGFNGKAPRLNALIMQPILGYWAEAPVYRRNVAEARRLLAEAGKTAIRARITVLNQPTFQTMALVARALLAEVGISVDVDVQEGATYWDAGKGDAGKNLDLFMMRFNGKLDPSFLMQWFVSSQIGTWNWQRFSSPEFDRLAAEAIVETDPQKRAALVIKAQQEMDKSAAFVWLTNDVAFAVRRATLKTAYLPGAIDWQLDHFAGA